MLSTFFNNVLQNYFILFLSGGGRLLRKSLEFHELKDYQLNVAKFVASVHVKKNYVYNNIYLSIKAKGSVDDFYRF